MTLTIDRNQLVYRKRGGAFGSALIESSFHGLSGADIVYGYSNRRSRITVSVPPHRVGGVWKMTVEGIELVRRN